jgi:hypothetical protein
MKKERPEKPRKEMRKETLAWQFIVSLSRLKSVVLY